jgi:hypothetical protein
VAIEGLIIALLDRRAVYNDVVSVLVRLLVGPDSNSAYLARFARYCKHIDQVKSEDALRLNTAIMTIVASPVPAEIRDECLSFYLPEAARFFGSVSGEWKLTFRADRLIEAIDQSSPICLQLIDYTILVASLLPTNWKSLVKRVTDRLSTLDRRAHVNAALALLGSKIAKHDFPNQKENLSDRLIEVFQNFRTRNRTDDPILSHLFEFILTITTDGDRLSPPCAKFILKIFQDADLKAEPEIAFFVQALRGLEEAQIQEVITDAVSTMKPYPKGKKAKQTQQHQALIAARKVSFLMRDVWPERRDAIRAKCNRTTILTFPTGAQGWESVNAAFGAR